MPIQRTQSAESLSVLPKTSQEPPKKSKPVGELGKKTWPETNFFERKVEIINIKLPVFTTPEPELFALPEGLIDGLDTSSPEAFKISLATILTSSYFKPGRDEFSSRMEYLQTKGARIENFFEVVIEKPGVRSNANMLKVLNLAHDEAYRASEVWFEETELETYWSMTRADKAGQKQTFVETFEKARDSLKPDDPERGIYQKSIDDLYTAEHVRRGVVDDDFEKTYELIVIDQKTRKTAEMVLDESGDLIGYVTADGEPIEKITCRQPKLDEVPRADFKVDWSKQEAEMPIKVDTWWWPEPERPNFDFPRTLERDSDSCFTREELLESLAALLDFGRVYTATEKTTGMRQHLWEEDPLMRPVEISPSELRKIRDSCMKDAGLLDAHEPVSWDDAPVAEPFIIRDGVRQWNKTFVDRGMVQLGDSAEAKESQAACVTMFDDLKSLIWMGLGCEPEEKT